MPSSEAVPERTKAGKEPFFIGIEPTTKEHLDKD
jgi:hypothetical protein